MNKLRISTQREKELLALARAIENHRNPRCLPLADNTRHLTVSATGSLWEEVVGNTGTYIVRCIYRGLNFDEHRLFKWRLEHKLVQASVLTHYSPGVMVFTIGLGDLLRRFGSNGLCEALSDIFPKGYFIKAALGECSGDEGEPNLAESILHDVGAGILNQPTQLTMADESYVVQEMIDIAHEYRVHTMESRVIPGLTYNRYERVNGKHDFELVNAYVQSILDQLPDGIIGQSLLGWDVAKTWQGYFVVVEVNITGYHPVYNPGFQCSGFFQDQLIAGEAIARLIRYLDKTYNVVVLCPLPTAAEHEAGHHIYRDIHFSQELLARKD